MLLRVECSVKPNSMLRTLRGASYAGPLSTEFVAFISVGSADFATAVD